MKNLFFYTMMLTAASLSVASCDRNDDKDEPEVSTKARLVLACDLNANGSDVSYLIPATDEELQGGMAALSRAHEVYGNAYVEAFNDWVFHLPVWKEPKITRYARNDDGTLSPDGSLTLSANGGAGLCNLLFISDTKAYASLVIDNKIVVFNPTTMTLTKTIDLAKPELTFDGQATPNPGGMILRDGKVFVGCFELADMPICLPGAYMIVIDEATDTPEKFISDERATSASFFDNEMFTDEKGDIYIACWASYGYAGENQKCGFLRIKKGQTEFDPDYFFNITDMTIPDVEGGKLQYVASCEYAGNGIAYVFGACAALFTGDWVNDKMLYSMKIDWYNKTVTTLPLPLTNSYSCSISKLGDEIMFGLTTTSNGIGLFSYNHKTGAVSSSPIISAPGTIMDVAVFE
jgi:hypothetical protein